MPAKKPISKRPTKRIATPKKATKKVSKKKPTPRELQEREANRIVNSSKAAETAQKRPRKRVTPAQEQALLEALVRGLQEKKASGLVKLDLRHLQHRIADYFLVAEAESKIQVRAIAESAEDFAWRYSKEKPYRSEGFENAEWVIVDFVNIVVHVFQREFRTHYQLEQLWGDAQITQISD